LYVWRAGKALVFLAKNKPRLLGAVWFPVAALLMTSAWFWVHGTGMGKQLPHAGLQDETSFVVWLFSAILAAWMIWANTAWLPPISSLMRRCFRPFEVLQIAPRRLSQVAGIIVVAIMVVIGLTTQLKIAQANLNKDSAINRFPPDAEAGVWISSHTDPNAIVMARHVPIVYHYSQRKVIWFPPSSNPQLLMEGIVTHRVNFLIVVRRQSSYYLPTDDDCFAPLLTAYPKAFHLIEQGPDFRIFQVVRNDPLLGALRSRSDSESAPGGSMAAPFASAVFAKRISGGRMR
jgi:hypothetical protein